MGFLKHNLFTSRKMTVSNDINESGAIYLDSEGVVIDETGELIEFTEDQEKVLATVGGFEKYELRDIEEVKGASGKEQAEEVEGEKEEISSKKPEVSEKPEDTSALLSAGSKSETEEDKSETANVKTDHDQEQEQEGNEKIEEQDKEESSEQTESEEQPATKTADQEKVLADEKPKKSRNTKTRE